MTSEETTGTPDTPVAPHDTRPEAAPVPGSPPAAEHVPPYPADPADLPAELGDAESAEVAAAPERSGSFFRWVLEMVVLVGIAFVLATGIKTFVVQPFIIPSGSMIPTLEINDRVLVNKFLYRFADPRQGDIVVFLEPGSEKTDYIKRIVAVGGQTVDLVDGKVYVDGQPLAEPYVHGLPSEPGDLQTPITVPPGQVFLMGDNRTNSRDSRWFGPQPVERVLGKAFVIYWPLPRFSLL